MGSDLRAIIIPSRAFSIIISGSLAWWSELDSHTYLAADAEERRS
jgi:hypothetical protein